MALSPGIGLVNLEENQQNPEVTTNTALNKIDNSIHRALAKTVTTADVTLSETEFLENGIVIASGAMTGARNLIVPATATVNGEALTVERRFNVINNCTGGFTLTVKTAAGTGIGIANGEKFELYCDGTNVIQLSKSA